MSDYESHGAIPYRRDGELREAMAGEQPARSNVRSTPAQEAQMHRGEIHAALREQRTQMIAYLRSKTVAEDWHAVQDAASDIREIDAKLATLALRYA